MTHYDVIVRPIVTEKAVGQQEASPVFCIEVNAKANKTQIKQAVEKLFSVKVDDVRTINLEGKLRRRGRFQGYASDWKKAYIRLKAGQKVPEFVEM